MRVALFSSACALGILSMAYGGCSKTHDRAPQGPTAAEQQRRIEEKRAEERRAEDRRWEEQRAEERRAEERRLSEERRLAEERRVAEERRAAERRADERPDRNARSIGGGPADPTLRATTVSAVSNIASARCDREMRCKNVGAKARYRTRAACVAEMQRDKREDLNADACPGGVREKELVECLQTIREEDCGNPLDTISRLSTCRTGNLCAK